jgi:cellulose synthase operon protein B
MGFANGLHFSDLSGHHEIYVPVPEDGDVSASDLVLVFDDISAHEARRTLVVQINDRTVAAIALDGKGQNQTMQVPLGGARPKDGYLKLAFLYSGAATPDHCIDVRYVGDSVTIRPETAVNIDIGQANRLDVATTAELMPRDVAVVLPRRRLAENEMATVITVGRALIASGRRVTFYDSYDAVSDLDRRDESGRWARGIILVGTLADAEGVIDSPIATVAGDLGRFGMIDAVRISGLPSLVIADAESVRAARLFGTPLFAATRGLASASVGQVTPIALPDDRVSFDQLGIAPEAVEVFGRADLGAIIDTRRLPAGRRPTRLSLDVMVAPDGAGAKAVVSVFVNDRLLGSTVAATDQATHLDLPLPDGLLGTIASLRVVVERDIAQGDCRFGPQGYPAQILGSSALVLGGADGAAHDFSDLTSRFVRGIDVLLPAAAANAPTHVLGMVAQVANQLSPDTAPIDVAYVASGRAPVPEAPFIALDDLPPAGANPHVRFDRGRVSVIDQAGHTLLDLGGFNGGAVAQVVAIGETPGLWIKPLSPDGQAPSPPTLHLDHGDVGFVDDKGVALAMSTERDTLVRISYPDQVSWLSVAERFRSWIIAGLWLLVTAGLLLTLQRLFRRRPADPSE